MAKKNSGGWSGNGGEMGKLMPVCVLFMWFGLCFRKWCYFFWPDFKGSVKLVFCWPGPVDGMRKMRWIVLVAVVLFRIMEIILFIINVDVMENICIQKINFINHRNCLLILMLKKIVKWLISTKIKEKILIWCPNFPRKIKHI